ncbi:hypothetical protein Tco_1326910 [Tanacetum coccineum]
MEAHTERMEWFKEAIYKKREDINERMLEMFSLLKELTKGKSPEKVLVREEVNKPITKYVNTVSLVRMENDKDKRGDKVVDKSIIDPLEPIEFVHNSFIFQFDIDPCILAILKGSFDPVSPFIRKTAELRITKVKVRSFGSLVLNSYNQDTLISRLSRNWEPRKYRTDLEFEFGSVNMRTLIK